MDRIDLPPVVVMDGEGAPNGISVARCLGRRGLKVYALCPTGAHLRYSRYSTWIPESLAGNTAEQWTRFLLGPASDFLRGAVLLACYDPALQILAGNRDRLLEKYRLDESNPTAQLEML